MTPQICLSPRLVRGLVVAGCGGKCAVCVAYARARWVARVGHETDGRKSWVVTLTYTARLNRVTMRFRRLLSGCGRLGLIPVTSRLLSGEAFVVVGTAI